MAIPPFDLQKEEKPSSRVPTLVVSGGRDLITSVVDGKKIAEYYGGKQIVFKRSSCMPFAEESPEFNKAVVGFLKKYAKRKPKSLTKADEKKSSTAKKKTTRKKSSKSSRSSKSSKADSEKKKKRTRKPRPKKDEDDDKRKPQ